MGALAQTYFGDILHIVSQALLVPTAIALIALILFALWCIGGVVVEAVRERRHFKVTMPPFLADMADADETEMPRIVAESGLLGDQKKVLETLWEYRGLPVDAHVALAKRLMEEQGDYHAKKLAITQVVSKVAPMLGLMGTLIPLGPGIVSLGQGDTVTLSASLLVAFDTTVAGLVVALLTFIITRIRQHWYQNYDTALEAAVATMLERVDAMREGGR